MACWPKTVGSGNLLAKESQCYCFTTEEVLATSEADPAIHAPLPGATTKLSLVSLLLQFPEWNMGSQPLLLTEEVPVFLPGF